MYRHNQPTDRREYRDLTDGRAFLILSKSTPLWLIASMANVSEAEVLRLTELAKADPARR